MYFGILGRDCAEVAADRMVRTCHAMEIGSLHGCGSALVQDHVYSLTGMVLLAQHHAVWHCTAVALQSAHVCPQHKQGIAALAHIPALAQKGQSHCTTHHWHGAQAPSNGSGRQLAQSMRGCNLGSGELSMIEA